MEIEDGERVRRLSLYGNRRTAQCAQRRRRNARGKQQN